MPIESSLALRPDTRIISPSRRDEPLGQARVIARPTQPTNIPVIGTVTDQTTGRPLSGVPVKLSDSKGKVVASGVSDAAGQVRVVVAAADVDASDEFTAQLDGGSETGVSQSADGTMRFAASTLQKRNGSAPYRVAEAKPPAQYAPSLAQIQVSPKIMWSFPERKMDATFRCRVHRRRSHSRCTSSCAGSSPKRRATSRLL